MSRVSLDQVQTMWRWRVSSERHDALRCQFAQCQQLLHRTLLVLSQPFKKPSPKTQTMWRGRASPEPRDELRRQFAQCPELFKALRSRDQELFNLWYPDVRLHEACAWR